jgi:predicted CXXCH cytochrome family protein
MSGDTKINGNSGSRAARKTRAILVLIVFIFAIDWWGCSVEKHYDLLSKFFDGVPDPNAVGSFDQLAISQSPTFSQHQPYIDEACSTCHPNPSEMLLTKGDSNVCLKCHKDIKDQYQFMHGAVTGTACLMCHNPHLSPLAHLLRQEAPGLCTQCHEMDTPNPIIEHQNLEQDCRSCHHAHGGDNPLFFLGYRDANNSDPETQPIRSDREQTTKDDL